MGLSSGMESFVPRWFSKGDDDMGDDHIEPPPIATLPAFDVEDEKRHVIEQSAALWAEARHNQQKAQIELIEAAQKIAFLEKENSEMRLQILELQNNNQTLVSQRDADLQFMSVVRRYLDARDVKAVPKKPRNGNGNKSAPPK